MPSHIHGDCQGSTGGSEAAASHDGIEKATTPTSTAATARWAAPIPRDDAVGHTRAASSRPATSRAMRAAMVHGQTGALE